MNKELKKFNINKKVFNYDNTYFWGIINSKTYELSCSWKNGLKIISEEPINDQSYEHYGLYYTKINLDDFDDIIQERLSAKYKGKIFPIAVVSRNFEYFRLDGTKLSSDEAKKYGFVYDMIFGQYCLDVSINDIEILSETVSIFDNLKNNLGR